MARSNYSLFALIMLFVASGTHATTVTIDFDSLANLEVITTQFSSLGVDFDEAFAFTPPAAGFDQTASGPNAANVNNGGASIFDGQDSTAVLASYSIVPQQFGSALTDVLFHTPGDSSTAATVDSVSIIVGMDSASGGSEINQVLLEAFDASFNVIDFAISSQLVGTTAQETLMVSAAGIRGVRISDADFTGFDDFTFTNLTAVPIPAAFWLFASALGVFGWLRRFVN